MCPSKLFADFAIFVLPSSVMPKWFRLCRPKLPCDSSRSIWDDYLPTYQNDDHPGNQAQVGNNILALHAYFENVVKIQDPSIIQQVPCEHHPSYPNGVSTVMQLTSLARIYFGESRPVAIISAFAATQIDSHQKSPTPTIALRSRFCSLFHIA